MQCEVVSDSPLCICVDNSMLQLSPNKETGIGDCCQVDVNGQVDVRRSVCYLMYVVIWLCKQLEMITLLVHLMEKWQSTLQMVPISLNSPLSMEKMMVIAFPSCVGLDYLNSAHLFLFLR